MRRRRSPRAPALGVLVVALVALGVPAPATASTLGELSGTVTGGGQSVPGVWVTLTPVTEDGQPTGTPTRTLTDGSGRYAFPQVQDRTVKVHVRAPLVGRLIDTYWPDAHTFTKAGIIQISTGSVTADVDLPQGGSVSGRVVDGETGAPVPDAEVSAIIAAAPASGTFGEPGAVQEPGEFALSGLPPVPMTLRVRLPAHSPYLDIGPGEHVEGVPIDGSRDASGLVLGLQRGAEIRGTVRDDTGAPVAGAMVKVVGCLPHCPLIATSDDAGDYRMVGVSPGARLGIVAWQGDRLLRQWYPGRDNASQANDIALQAGDVLDGVDFRLTRGAFVTVGVRGADSGRALTGAIVQLISSTDPHDRYVALRSLGGPGRMRLGPVPPGSYRVRVSPGTSNPGYAPVGQRPDEGAAPGGVIHLAAEDDLDLVAELPAAAAEGGEHLTPTGWPGLADGFLALDGQVHPPW